MNFSFDNSHSKAYMDARSYEKALAEGTLITAGILSPQIEANVKGWVAPKDAITELDVMKQKAEEIRRDAEVFVLIGVGGSNQSARAMIEALKDKTTGPEIIYAGNTLSSYEIQHILARIKGKSIYINCIAKNFETLEPGSHFRLIRQYMESVYSKEEVARRIVVTGTEGSRLWDLAKEHGFTFLHFPSAIGGRYTAFCPVGLFPLFIAGLDVDAYISGFKAMHAHISTTIGEQNMAIRYAATRQSLRGRGYDVEMLVAFEPRLFFAESWWKQLFGESEGKEKSGILPTSAIYSEDLHSMGQYLQDGKRILSETFIRVTDPGASVIVKPDEAYNDAFTYLEGQDFADINHKAEEATLEAHEKGGVPECVITIPRLDEESFGALYYFFMFSCAISGKLAGVNPFDQEGVEEYKRSMFKALGK